MGRHRVHASTPPVPAADPWEAAKRRAAKVRTPHVTFAQVREAHRPNPEVVQGLSLERIGYDPPCFDREDDEWVYYAARARTQKLYREAQG